MFHLFDYFLWEFSYLFTCECIYFSKFYLIFKDVEVFGDLLYCYCKWSFLCQIKAGSASYLIDDDAFLNVLHSTNIFSWLSGWETTRFSTHCDKGWR